jgi:hypothetical protein
MTSDANPDAFLALLTQGLITDAQHDAVLAHPETSRLPPLPGPAHALAWMRVRGLITEDEQNAALDRVYAAEPASPHTDDASDSAIDADDLMELADQGITHEALHALHGNGLIDTDLRDTALQETPIVGTVPPALPATLAWLVNEELLDAQSFEALRGQVAAEPAFAMAAERARIVNEAHALIDADVQAVKTWQSRAKQTRRIGAMKFMLSVLVIGGGLGWYFLWPDSVPACDAASTRKTLDNLMFRVAVDVRMRTIDPEERGALAVVFLQVALAQAHALGRDLDQLVVLDELDAVLQRQLDRRRDLDRVFLARDTEVGQLLGAGGVDHQVVVAAVDADDHALVHRVVGAHEHAAAVVQLAQGVGEDLAVVHGDQHAVLAAADLALVRLVACRRCWRSGPSRGSGSGTRW